MFSCTLVFTPIFQLKGVALAQVIQSVFIFLGAIVLTYKISIYNRFSFWKWSPRLFKELFNYGYKFQVVSISQLLYEPCTKLLLSKFGGLSFLGYYEMASRMVNQFRALLVNANQVVIPVVAQTAKAKTKENLQVFFKKMNQILFFFTIPLSTALLIAIPVISVIWVGDINIEFIFSAVALTISAIVNIMCGPSYFSCLAEGRLSILVFVHMGMAFVNLALGYLLGMIFAGYGITLAWGLALIAGSIIIISAYSKKISVSYFSIFSKQDKKLLIITFLIIVLGTIIFLLNDFISLAVQCVMLISVLLLYIPFLTKYDEFKKIIQKLK
jgi:O-antigen/teichoic acid export membrane protein